MILTDPQDDLEPGSFSLLTLARSSDVAKEPPLWQVVSDDRLLEELYRLCGEFCHEARNRLNSLHLCLYLSRPEETTAEEAHWERLETSYRETVQQIELIQTICRPMRLELMPLSLELLIDDRAEAWSKQWRSRGSRLEFRPPPRLARGLIDPMLLTRALDGLAAWRASSATPETLTTIQWWEEGGEFALDWIESPANGSVQPELYPARPEVRTNGTLTLALLARVVHEHGGGIDQTDEPSFRVSLRWPSRNQEMEADEQFSCPMSPGRP